MLLIDSNTAFNVPIFGVMLCFDIAVNSSYEENCKKEHTKLWYNIIRQPPPARKIYAQIN
jgi:hypothetical protein